VGPGYDESQDRLFVLRYFLCELSASVVDFEPQRHRDREMHTECTTHDHD